MKKRWTTMDDLREDAKSAGFSIDEDLDYPAGYVIKQVRVGVTHFELKCLNEEVVEAFFLGYGMGYEDA